jgi:hypothetical protein
MTTQINGTTGLTFSDSSVQNTAAIGFRNRIINGGMVIDQRNAGASVTQTSSYPYTLDRWQCGGSVSSKFTVQQSSTAPTGFVNSSLITSSSAYTVGAGENFVFFQNIEGYNTADLMWGTANAQTVTLSFWVRSSLTGTFGGSIQNSATNRSYPFTYTISTANTWELETITIPGDTSGTWLTTNGCGIIVRYGLGVGSTGSGTAGAWAGANYLSATGAVSVVGTNAATWYVTGVQLEKATTASSFDFRSYGTELALCQRYYWKTPASTTYAVPSNNATVTNGYFFGQSFSLPVQMRAAPTGTKFGTFGVGNCGQPAVVETDVNSVFFAAVASGTGPGYFNSNSSGGFTVSAEL